MLQKADTKQSQNQNVSWCAAEDFFFEKGTSSSTEILDRKDLSWAAGQISPFKVSFHRIPTWNFVPHEFRLNQLQTALLLEFTTNTRRSRSVNAEMSLKITPRYSTSCFFSEKLLQLSQFLEGNICCIQRQGSKTISISNGVKYSALLHVFKVSRWQLHTSASNTEESLLWNSSCQPWCHPPQKPAGECAALCKGARSWFLLRAQHRAETKGLQVSGIQPCWSTFSPWIQPSQAHCNL